MSLLFVLCYDAHIKCCVYAGEISVAGTFSANLLTLQWRLIHQLLHYTENLYIDMVIKRMVFYCID